MRIIDETKPSFMFSLHNAGFCGVYYYLSHDIKDMFPGLVNLVKEEGLPLHQGEPESPYIKELHPGIFQMFGIQGLYDFYEENGVENPQELILNGTSSDDYLRRVTNNTGFTLVCEMPYFYDIDLGNESFTEDNRRDLILEDIEISKNVYSFTKERFEIVRPYCSLESRMYTSVADNIDNFEKRIRPRFHHAKTSPMYEGKATVAQAFNCKVAWRYYDAFRPAMVARLCDEASTAHPEARMKILDLKEELDQFVETTIKETLKGTNFEVIPIQKLVKVQVGSALNCMRYI